MAVSGSAVPRVARSRSRRPGFVSFGYIPGTRADGAAAVQGAVGARARDGRVAGAGARPTERATRRTYELRRA